MYNKWVTCIVGLVVITVFLAPVIAQNNAENIPNLEGEKGNRDWTIVATFPVPESASGLAYDGTYLYCGIYGSNGDDIYQIDPATGNYVLLCSGPQEDAYGLTYDGTYLWTTDHPGSSSDPAIAYQFNLSGNTVSQFNLPDHYMSGIAYDNGDFWVATYYPDPSTIYKVNATGSIITSFTAPDDQPWDLAVEGDYLWMADYWGDTLYKINKTTGALIESHASEYTDPAGIVWDGQYLWYCDNGQGGNDYLYKVDLAGSGTPGIEVPITIHNYGVATIGQSAPWQVTVQNTGTADLQITNITYTGQGSTYLSCPLTFPLIVTPGNQTQIPINYTPLSYGELDALAIISSNDPVHPTVELTLIGNAVYPGIDIDLPTPSHNYGTVRINAYTRWFLTIQNTGNTTLTITDITSDSTHFIVDDQTSYPFTIGVLQSKNVSIWFQPTAPTGYTGTLAVYSTDIGESPLYATVQGTGLQDEYPIGDLLWHYTIDDPYDSSPRAMAPINDINGDGKSDVIICSEGGYIRCFNGNAHITGDVLWEHEIPSGYVYRQNGLVITQDLDSDGFDDVIMGSTGWGIISAISGKTGGTIWAHYTNEYGNGGWVYQVDSQFDYNGDGIKDVLAATGDDGSDTGPKRVYCLDALTGISIWERPLGGPVFAVIGTEDFTGDGQPDAVAGASNGDETIGYVYGINGATGGQLWTFTTATATSVWALEQIDDISNDGIKDVIAADFYTAAGTIYGLDATNGDEKWSNNLGLTMTTRFEKIDDVNNDGHPDILPACLATTLVRVIDGYTGSIIWSESVLDQPSTITKTSDINGDGINDVVVGTLYTNNYCYWFDGTDGTELCSLNMGNPIDAITSIPDVVGDENNTWEVIIGGRWGSVTCVSGGGELPENFLSRNISLYQDWNLVTVPLDNGWTAETLGQNISGCSVVTMFEGSTQTFVTHVVGTPHDDFPIVDGGGYFIYLGHDSYLNMTSLPITTVTVPIYTGWDLVGWYHDSVTTAESLGTHITGCTIVSMFNATSQTFTSHVVGTPHDNFPVTPGMGVFVYATSDSTWTGQG